MFIPLCLPCLYLLIFHLIVAACLYSNASTTYGGSSINITCPFTTDPHSKWTGSQIRCHGSTPTIQFDDDIGHSYPIVHIDENVLTVQDPDLSKLMLGSNCNFLYDFKRPYPSFDPALFVKYLTSKYSSTPFNRNPSEYDFSHIFDGLKNFPPCEDYSLHYLFRVENQSIDSSCRPSSPPLFEWRLSFEEENDGLSLRSAGFSKQLVLNKDCFPCHIESGHCTDDTVVGDDGCRCSSVAHRAGNGSGSGWEPHVPLPNQLRLSDGTSRRKLVKIGIGVGVGGGLFAVCFICCICYNRGRITPQPWSSSKSLIHTESSSIKEDQEMSSNNYCTHVFSYAELHEATSGFDESRELGDGGFGTVYKGQLRDERVVAVKRLYENTFKRVEQFLNEVDILSRLRHPNLVTLYGCTSRHSRELLLVYEFVPNGTVADHLHGPRRHENGLTWPNRLSIAIETAEALAYLHNTEPQIIHRDVKTTNILLDNNFRVKVADFGLSRLFPLDATHVSTLPQGTPGYVDPEYRQCYQLTEKSDVYSFGVVLVELISSMPAVDISRHRHEINLANLAINKIQNREVEQLVDPRLVGGDWEIQRMTNMVAEVAFRCLQADGEMRPSIKEVLEELRRIDGRGEKGLDAAEIGEDEVLFSPDTVTVRWDSRSTTPNTSA